MGLEQKEQVDGAWLVTPAGLHFKAALYKSQSDAREAIVELVNRRYPGAEVILLSINAIWFAIHYKPQNWKRKRLL